MRKFLRAILFRENPSGGVVFAVSAIFFFAVLGVLVHSWLYYLNFYWLYKKLCISFFDGGKPHLILIFFLVLTSFVLNLYPAFLLANGWDDLLKKRRQSLTPFHAVLCYIPWLNVFGFGTAVLFRELKNRKIVLCTSISLFLMALFSASFFLPVPVRMNTYIILAQVFVLIVSCFLFCRAVRLHDGGLSRSGRIPSMVLWGLLPLTLTVCLALDCVCQKRIRNSAEAQEKLFGRRFSREDFRLTYYPGKEVNADKKEFGSLFAGKSVFKEGFSDLFHEDDESSPYYGSDRWMNLTEEHEKNLTAYIEKHRKPFGLYELLLKEPYLKLSRDDTLLVGILLPELSVYRDMARMAALRVHRAIVKKDRSGMLRAYGEFLKIRSFIADREEVFCIEAIVVVILDELRFAALERMIESGLLTDADIRKIQCELAQETRKEEENRLKDRRAFLYFESYCVLDNFDFFWNREFSAWLYFTVTDYYGERLYVDYSERSLPPEKDSWIFRFLFSPMLLLVRTDELCGVEYYEAHGRRLRPGDYFTYADSLPRNGKHTTESLSAYFGRSTATRGDSMGKTLLKHESAIGLKRAVYAGLSVELYRRKYGKLPDSLQALVPEFLDAVPKDPMDGQPLRYRRDKAPVILYDVSTCQKRSPEIRDNSYEEYFSSRRRPEREEVPGWCVFSIGRDLKDDRGQSGTIPFDRFSKIPPGQDAVFRIVSGLPAR